MRFSDPVVDHQAPNPVLCGRLTWGNAQVRRTRKENLFAGSNFCLIGSKQSSAQGAWGERVGEGHTGLWPRIVVSASIVTGPG